MRRWSGTREILELKLATGSSVDNCFVSADLRMSTRLRSPGDIGETMAGVFEEVIEIKFPTIERGLRSF